MRKALTLTAALVAACFGALAQDDVQKAAAEAAAAFSEAPKAEEPVAEPNYWTTFAVFDLGFNQTSLTSWAAGGYNTLALAAGMDAKAIYAKDLLKWDNRLQLNYGFLWSADKTNLLQKSNDRIYAESKLAYKTAKTSKWDFTASFDFRSQFTNSYDKYVQDQQTKLWSGTLKSGFLSPAYTNIALGMEWAPTNWFNINIAPLTGGFTICTINDLKKGYGMKPFDENDLTLGYRSALFQFGAQVKINFKASINDVIGYDTQLVIFTDYLNKPFVFNRVNWDNKITWQLAKFFKVGLSTWLIYDPIITIDGVTSKTQFKEFVAINFTYSISNKK